MKKRLVLLMLGIATAAAAAPPFAPPAITATTVYRNARIIDGTGAAPRDHATIVVTGERITRIADDAAFSSPAGATVIDLTGRTVIPGMVDSHVHMATPPNAVQAKAMLRRNLYGGVTLVRDMADDLRSVAELAREAREGEIAAPDIVFAALMAGPSFFADPRVGAASKGWAPGTAPWMKAVDRSTDLPQAIGLAKATGAAAIKIYADLPPERVAAITAEAHRQGMLVWAHTSVFPTRPADVIAAGADAVSHACYLAYQLEPVMLASYEDHTPVHASLIAHDGDDPGIAPLYREMLRRGTVLDATGALFVRAEAERKAHPERSPLRCDGPQTIRLTAQAWRAGVPISTGTDHIDAADRPWPEMYAELFFLVRDVGMPPLQAIRSATLNGAKAAGLERETGSIEVGKLADFAVLARDPLTDIANVESIELTVKRGRAFRRADFPPLKAEEISDR